MTQEQYMKGDDLRELLRRRVMRVTFTKKDGTVRKLRGTLNMDLVPESALPKNPGFQPPEGIVRVFDLDLGEWRSFSVDSVSELEMLDANPA